MNMVVQAMFGEPLSDRLLPGERADLKLQIVELLGDEWLRTENISFGMRRPDELIGTDEEGRVRDLLRSLSVSALS